MYLKFGALSKILNQLLSLKVLFRAIFQMAPRGGDIEPLKKATFFLSTGKVGKK